MEKNRASSDIYRVLHPECRPGFWIIQDPGPCRVFVTGPGEKITAILLDDFEDQCAFNLLDLSSELTADHMGTAFLQGDDRGVPHDYQSVGCLIVRDEQCYLTCEKNDKLTLIEIDEVAWASLPRDGEFGFNWRLLWWYDEAYEAVVYEAFNGKPGLIA